MLPQLWRVTAPVPSTLPLPRGALAPRSVALWWVALTYGAVTATSDREVLAHSTGVMDGRTGPRSGDVCGVRGLACRLGGCMEVVLEYPMSGVDLGQSRGQSMSGAAGALDGCEGTCEAIH